MLQEKNRMKKKLIWITIVAVFVIGGYYLSQIYIFGQGVVEDTKRIEEYELPKEIKLTDSTTLNIGIDSVDISN